MVDVRLQGTPIWVYAKDVNTKLSIAPHRIVEGAVGDAFTIEPVEIEGYRFVKAEGSPTGIFNMEGRTVTFYYRRNSYMETEVLDDKYLRLFREVPTYTDLKKSAPAMPLWNGTVVKVVERVATADGEFWYQIADTRWVPFNLETMQLVNKPESTTAPDVTQRPTTQLDLLARTAVEKHGVVDYVSTKDVTVYDVPYGKEVGRAVHGLRVDIDEVARDAAGVEWYHIVDLGWISKIYLKLD
ncbi:MucBP domain-containing protein [Weissella ceti]|uniref:MucBP domain-containing protein n=1 Tax=Weissella ceti TaxID=759620 RepID=A0ABT3E4P0_9LACO|nr:MucBP domain-containing protein [Weissella ceti]MCW0953378.1 MucBP domain-containing protein [Weissella ceti]QVK11982.1 MucBP domain-containing protein [Weissella ceti]